MNTSAPRACLHCGNPLKGRTDKKFCDDYCRSTFNNSLNGESNKTVRNINNRLRRNRRILEQLLRNRGSRLRTLRDNLCDMGFDFNYYTHTHNTGNGLVYFCYEYGYLPLEGEVMLMRQEKG